MLTRLILATFAIQIVLTEPLDANQAAKATTPEQTVNQRYAVGYEQGHTLDPMGGELRYSIWYPSADNAGTTSLGPFRFAAKTAATPAPGKFPLVLLSHGSGGNHLGHRNLAIALAQAGIVAAAPSHPRDNSQDQSGVGHRIVWEGRPLQITAVVNDLLQSEQWSARLHPQRIGIFGFSLGGYTALALLGARPSLATLIEHCHKHSGQDPLCRYGGGLAAAMQQVLQEEYRSADSKPPRDLIDTRFCSAALADPLAAVFTDDALNNLATIPIRIYLPEHENELAAQFNGGRVADIIEHRNDKGLRPAITMADAHHYTFIAPFPQILIEQLPAAFKDPPELDRKAFDNQFETDVRNFFVDSLATCGQV